MNKELRIGLFALKDIRAMEVITYDYKWEIADEESNTQCLCRSANCRGSLKKVIVWEETEIECDFASATEINNDSYWMIDPTKISNQPESYEKYCKLNNIDPSNTNTNAQEISERLTTKDWSLLCEKCLTYVINKMRHQHHKDSHTKLISCFTGYLRTHLHRIKRKKGEISKVYTTLFELLFVKVSSLLGFKMIDNVVMIPAKATSNMWILSRMCFGELVNDDSNPLIFIVGELVNDDSNPLIFIDLKECSQTKLGAKV